MFTMLQVRKGCSDLLFGCKLQVKLDRRKEDRELPLNPSLHAIGSRLPQRIKYQTNIIPFPKSRSRLYEQRVAGG